MYKYSEIPSGKEEDIIFLKCVASETVLIEFFKKWRDNEPIRKSSNFFTTGSITWIFKSYWNTGCESAFIENNKYSMNFERSFFEEIKPLDFPWRLKTQAEMLRDGQIVPGDTRPIVWDIRMEKYFGALIPKSVVKKKFDFNLAMTGSSKSFCIGELGGWNYRYEQMTYAPLEESSDTDIEINIKEESNVTSYWRFKTKEEFIEEGRWQSKGHPSDWNSRGEMNKYLGERIPKEYISYCEKGQSISLPDVDWISDVGWIFQSRDYTNKPLPTSSSKAPKAPETPVRYRFKTEAEFKSEDKWTDRGYPRGWVTSMLKYLGKEIPKEFIQYCEKRESFNFDSWFFGDWSYTPITSDSPSKTTSQVKFRFKTVDEFKAEGCWAEAHAMATGLGIRTKEFFKQTFSEPFNFSIVPYKYKGILGKDIYGVTIDELTEDLYKSHTEIIPLFGGKVRKEWFTSAPLPIPISGTEQDKTLQEQIAEAGAEMIRVYDERVNPCTEMVRELDPYESEGSLQLREMRPSNKLNAELTADSRLLEEAKIHLYISKKSNLLTIN